MVNKIAKGITKTLSDKSKDAAKIERAAARSVEEYIDIFPRMESNIFRNDKTPFWDGDILLYQEEHHTNNSFIARIPVQVKGTTNTKHRFIRIKRDYVVGYKADRGCVSFVVQEDKSLKTIKIFYRLLSTETINRLLRQNNTKTVKIELNEIPTDPHDFEIELINFARERNGERIENPATKEIESLLKKFEYVENYLDSIESIGVRYDLESFLNTIKELKYDKTVNWRDKFVHYSQKIIELVTNNTHACGIIVYIQFEFGIYLYEQCLYSLAEKYFIDSLLVFRAFSKVNPDSNLEVADCLSTLAVLHREIGYYDEAEREFQEALTIYRSLANTTSGEYLDDVARVLTNLGSLHKELTRYDKAEEEYQEALTIYRALANTTTGESLGEMAITRIQLGELYFTLKGEYSEGIPKEDLVRYKALAENNNFGRLLFEFINSSEKS